MIRLEAENLHWLEGSNETDLCAHGSVRFEIGEHVIVDPSAGDWTISAAALYLLRTLTKDHIQSDPVAEHLIPCCGFTMLSEQGTEDVFIIGCLNGINWDVTHDRDFVTLQFDYDHKIIVSLSDWAMAVCMFSDQVEALYKNSTPKQPNDEGEAAGYTAFQKEWKRRRLEANNLI